MINKLVLLFSLLYSIQAYSQDTSNSSIYSYIATDLNASQHPLIDFKGKKIWFVILPSNQDSAGTVFLQLIDSIAQANIDSMQFIAVPSLEDGYADDSSSLLNWYETSLHANIISQPLYTHINSVQQDSIFNWLTHSSLNQHFDNDVSGAGTMFCINAQGQLIGVFCTAGLLSKNTLNKIFN